MEAQGGQVYWGDAFYVKEDLAFGPVSSAADALRDAVIAYVLGFGDLAHACIKRALPELVPAVREDLSRYLWPAPSQG